MMEKALADVLVQVHVFMSGGVQGVFFRDWTKRTAESLGLSGWVRNIEVINTDKFSGVEAVFCGSRGKVEKMIELCHHGPRLAKVEKVKVFREKPAKTKGFEIKY